MAGKELIGKEQHKSICGELNALYVAKNADYGDSFSKSLDEDGLLVSKIRIGDKFNRFSTLIKQEAEVEGETLKDTLVDLANYAIMTIMWMEDPK